MVIRSDDFRFALSEQKKMKTGESKKETVVVPPSFFENFLRRANADFGDVLTLVEGYTQIALRKLREGRLKEEHLQHILRTLQRGAGLTEDISGFFTYLPESGEICDVAEAVRLVAETLQAEEDEGAAPLHLSLPEQPCLIKGNIETLAHVLIIVLPYIRGNKGELSDLSLSLNHRKLKDGREQIVLSMLCAEDGVDMKDSVEKKSLSLVSQMGGRQDCPARLHLACILVERMGGCICATQGTGGRGRHRFQIFFPVAS